MLKLMFGTLLICTTSLSYAQLLSATTSTTLSTSTRTVTSTTTTVSPSDCGGNVCSGRGMAAQAPTMTGADPYAVNSGNPTTTTTSTVSSGDTYVAPASTSISLSTTALAL